MEIKDLLSHSKELLVSTQDEIDDLDTTLHEMIKSAIDMERFISQKIIRRFSDVVESLRKLGLSHFDYHDALPHIDRFMTMQKFFSELRRLALFMEPYPEELGKTYKTFIDRLDKEISNIGTNSAEKGQ